MEENLIVTVTLLSKRSLSSRIVVNISHFFSCIRNEIYRTPGKIYIWHWIPVDGAPQARIAIHLALINHDRVDLGLATPKQVPLSFNKIVRVESCSYSIVQPSICVFYTLSNVCCKFSSGVHESIHFTNFPKQRHERETIERNSTNVKIPAIDVTKPGPNEATATSPQQSAT
ncbi:hypothetical protein WN51_06468 [Melipona quadrifasciata]|uniref:Uncharacterized protein n=1 Tax=Melipona quadrifasciata TaxID=166423 RepID=A0A0N0BK40_9HYME|nr:hypothetical protein WN51_06468 [Melipona quadrifasciata]